VEVHEAEAATSSPISVGAAFGRSVEPVLRQSVGILNKAQGTSAAASLPMQATAARRASHHRVNRDRRQFV